MSAGSPSPAALEVCELCAGYQMMPRAITDISFIVQPGESVAILGPNGAGKSTLLLALAGLVPHETGEVRVHGHDCQHMNVQIGLVPQRNAIDPNFPRYRGRSRDDGLHARQSLATLVAEGGPDSRKRSAGKC